jgi:hypothetical protein
MAEDFATMEIVENSWVSFSDRHSGGKGKSYD